MADAQGGLQFLERGVGMFFHFGQQLGRVEFAPGTPARLGGQSVGFNRRQITVNRAAPHPKVPPGLRLGPSGLKKSHHSFAQIQSISFHPHNLISYCPNVDVKYYSYGPMFCKRKNADGGALVIIAPATGI